MQTLCGSGIVSRRGRSHLEEEDKMLLDVQALKDSSLTL